MKKIACIALSSLLLTTPAMAGISHTLQPPVTGELEQPFLPPATLPDQPSEEEDIPQEEIKPTEKPVEPEKEEDHPSYHPEILTTTYIAVKKDGLNVRTGAGTGYSSLGGLEEGTLLAYFGTKNGWHETRYKNKVAFVSASTAYTGLLSLETGRSEVENVISNGLLFLGTPYVYGAVRLHDGNGKKLSGFTNQKFDCSSLMQYIFYNGSNRLLGMTTRNQVLQGKLVTDEIKRGDLLFFTNETRQHKTGIERVGHVALYLGNNYILHTASDFAKIEQISAKRWSFYLSARRFFA